MNENASFDIDTLKAAVRLSCILDDLKTRVRSGWTVWKIDSERLESVYEHCADCLVLANLLYPLYPDRDKVNIDRVNKMLANHEIGEAIIGDVPITDQERHDNKADDEHRAWRLLLKDLPYGDEVYDLLMEFDGHETPDSRFAYFIDKIVAMKQMKRYHDEGKVHSLEWCMENCEKVRTNKRIIGLVANGMDSALDVWFDEVWQPYRDDEFFMAAHRILYEMDTNIKPPSLPD